MLNNLFTKGKESRLQNRARQRQRMSRKMIIILGSSIACLVIALVIVINVSNVEKTRAELTGSTDKTVVIMPDEVYPTTISVKEPPHARMMPVAPNAQLGRVAKPLTPNN